MSKTIDFEDKDPELARQKRMALKGKKTWEMSDQEYWDYLLPEEREYEHSIEEWKPVTGKELEEIEAITVAAAKNYMKKDKRINIRLSSFDLQQLKSKAAREGLPYQTMISSILHKVANGLLDDRLNVHS